jgi:hypothetical protein
LTPDSFYRFPATKSGIMIHQRKLNEEASFSFESPEHRRREVPGFSAKERKTARGGSLPVSDSRCAKIVSRYSLTGLNRGRYLALPVGMRATFFVGLEQREQRSRVAFPTGAEIGQGRQLVNDEELNGVANPR